MLEMEQYTRHSSRNDDRSGDAGAAGGQGFVVKDAPWDKQQAAAAAAAAPNTSSIEEFPSFGDNSMAASSGGPRPSWGPRR